MSLKDNPYGVGYSGATAVMKDGRCVCCALPFSFRSWSTEPAPATCPNCESHQDTDDSDRTTERLLEHEPRLLAYVAAAKAAANKLQREAAGSREKVASALRSRERWQAVLTEVRSLHDEGEHKKCRCGLAWPCETWQVLQEDKGIARELNTRAYRQLITEDDRYHWLDNSPY